MTQQQFNADLTTNIARRMVLALTATLIAVVVSMIAAAVWCGNTYK